MTGLRNIGESAASAVLERVGRGVSKVQERRPLSYDLLESDDAFLVVFDAPGATREDVEVRFHDDEVSVDIERFRGFHEGFEMRLPGRGLSLSGTAELPAGAAVEPTEASATITDSGTLRIRIPKEESARSIAVDEEADADAGGGADEADEDGIGTADPAESDVVDAVTDRDLDPADEADVDPSPGGAGDDETGGEPVESAESDVVDAVTDRDLDPAGEETGDRGSPNEGGDRDGLDEEAGDYGGAVTGDETNTGAVDVDSDGEDEDESEDGDRGRDA